MFKKASLVLLCMSTLSTSAIGGSFEKTCFKNLPPPRFQIITENSAIVYDFSKSYKELTQVLMSGNKTLGLAQATLKIESEFKVSENYTSKKSCISPDVVLKITVSPQKIFIGKEFYQNTCVFNEIAEHELQHVKINQAEVEAIAKDLENMFKKTFPKEIIFGQRADQWKNQFNIYLKTKLMPAIEARFKENVDKKHSLIDSTEEYTRMSSICNGAVNLLAK